MTAESTTKKVFISYSWSSADHSGRVKSLADRLISNGINVLLDRYDLKQGQDKFVYMERSVNDPEVTKVLMICDPEYKRKSDSRDRGVGHESTIISKQLYDSAKNDGDGATKFIPILFENMPDESPALPAMLASRIYIDMTSEEKLNLEFESLVRLIEDQPFDRRPKLGSKPNYVTNPSQSPMTTTGQLDQFKTMITQGRIHFASGILDDYLTRIEEFMKNIPIAVDSKGLSHNMVWDDALSFTPYKAEWAEIFAYRCKYAPELPVTERLISFFERVLGLRRRIINNTSYDGQDDTIRFILRELFMYTLVVLSSHSKFEEVNEILSHDYLFYDGVRLTDREQLFDVFDEFLQALDVYRAEEMNLRKNTVHANLIIETAISSEVTVDSYIEMDIILFVRAAIAGNRWRPTSLYAPRRAQRRENLFKKARSTSFFNKFVTLFGVESKSELITRWNSLDDTSRSVGGHEYYLNGYETQVYDFNLLATKP